MKTKTEFRNRARVKPEQSFTPRSSLFPTVLVLLMLGFAGATYSVTNTVTTLADNGPGSLRQVIQDSVTGDNITFNVTGTIDLTSGELVVAKDLAIRGPGAPALAISGHYSSRVLYVAQSANVSISNLTIRDGKAPDGHDGGGIYNLGTLSLIGTTVNGNCAGGGGPSGFAGGDGGGIYNLGTLNMSRSTISGNCAGNGADGGWGGGLYLGAGHCVLSNCIFKGNAAGSGFMGDSGNYYGGGGFKGGNGGGICGGGAVIINCTFTNNRAGRGGMGGYGQIESGGGGDGGDGGGVYASSNLIMSGCTVVSNTAGPGGWANWGGGYSGTGGKGGFGGGICSGGRLLLTNCTIAGNWGGEGGGTWDYSGDGGDGGNGGGIYSDFTNVAIVACTITSNSAGWNGGYGSANGIGGGICSRWGDAPLLLNDIVAQNIGDLPDVAGTFQSLGHNLIGVEAIGGEFSAPGDLVGLDPKLGPLADNGGPTLTMALLPGSPAIDAGDDDAPPTDQRGVARPVGVASDIGAYECSAPFVTAVPPSQTIEAGSSVDFCVGTVGDPALAYLWFFDATNFVVSSTSPDVMLTNLQFSESGIYTVVITNAFGAVTSAPVMLNVIPAVGRRPVPALNLIGDAGTSLNVEYTDALGPPANWLPLDTVNLTNPPQYCVDASAALPPQRFYRVWQRGTPATPPSLNLPFLVPAITLTGNIGGQLRLDYINAIGPTDAWVTLDTVTLTNTSQLYFDTSSIGQPRRLYRIVPVP